MGTATLDDADPSQFSVSSDTCSGRAVAAGGTCTVQVAFGPSSAGAKTATLTVPTNATLSPVAAGLSGTATAAPVVAPTPIPTPTPEPLAPVDGALTSARVVR